MKLNKFQRLYWDTKRHLSNFRFRVRKLLKLPREMDFRYVDLVFENCNSVRIPAELVSYLNIEDIRKDVWTNFSQQYIETTYCKNFEITFDIKALDILTRFQDSSEDWRSSFTHHLSAYKDITHIAVKPTKGRDIYVAVPYKTENKNTDRNLLQTHSIVNNTFVRISCRESDYDARREFSVG